MNWSVTQIKTRVMLQLCCSWYYRKLLFSSCVGMCVREGKKWEHWAVTQPKFIPGWSETSLQSQHNQKLCEHRASPSLCWLSPSLGNAHLPNIPSLSPLSGFHFPSQDTKPELCIHNSLPKGANPLLQAQRLLCKVLEEKTGVIPSLST